MAFVLSICQPLKAVHTNPQDEIRYRDDYLFITEEY
jgi:hypothetical protein